MVASFAELAGLPDDEIDVALGAALIASEMGDRTDPRAVIATLDALAAPLGDLSALAVDEQARRVTQQFTELGFHGNIADYYDPKNSLLPEVLERRLGIPITLSIVWSEIAKRAGVDARGVGFPGHFLVRVEPPRARRASVSESAPLLPLLVDAFHGGEIVTLRQAERLVRRALGERAELRPSLFEPASPRTILLRLLTNLKAIWSTRAEHARAFVTIDRMLILAPDEPGILRERATLALQIGATNIARADFERVLELEPEAPDAPSIQVQLGRLGRTTKRPMN